MKHYEQEEKSDIVVNEELMYEALVGSEEIEIDGEFDIDNYYERHKEAIEAAIPPSVLSQLPGWY